MGNNIHPGILMGAMQRAAMVVSPDERDTDDLVRRLEAATQRGDTEVAGLIGRILTQKAVIAELRQDHEDRKACLRNLADEHRASRR